LFDNSGRKFNYKKSKELYNKSELEVKEVIENTLLQLYTIFYEVCRLIEEKEIIRSSLEISKSRLERKKTKFDFGQSTKLELLNAEVDVNTDSIRYLNSIKNLSNAKRDLNLVMNVDLNSNYDLDNDVLYNSDENILSFYNDAFENNTKLKIYSKTVDISNFELKSIRSTYLPTLGLIGSYDWNESSNNNPYAFFNKNIYDGISGGINLSWDIFNSGKRITANKNAKVRLENSKIEKEKAYLIFQKELNNSYETYKNNLFILNVQEQSLNTSDNNFQRNLEKYEIGLVSSIEFRNAQINLLNAKLARNTARYDAKISELYFLKISGVIIDNSF
jgi:outer membrane protein TolC